MSYYKPIDKIHPDKIEDRKYKNNTAIMYGLINKKRTMVTIHDILSNFKMLRASVLNLNIKNTELRNMTLIDTRLKRPVINETIIKNSLLKNIKIKESDISNLFIQDSQVDDIWFSLCNVRRLFLHNIEGAKYRFTQTIIKDTNFKGKNLSNSKFCIGKLIRVNYERANLCGTIINMRHSECSFKGAIYDKNTVLPDDIIPKDEYMVYYQPEMNIKAYMEDDKYYKEVKHQYYQQGNRAKAGRKVLPWTM